LDVRWWLDIDGDLVEVLLKIVDTSVVMLIVISLWSLFVTKDSACSSGARW
jgi:hypothetical protein